MNSLRKRLVPYESQKSKNRAFWDSEPFKKGAIFLASAGTRQRLSDVKSFVRREQASCQIVLKLKFRRESLPQTRNLPFEHPVCGRRDYMIFNKRLLTTQKRAAH